jgi:hypothetical protein
MSENHPSWPFVNLRPEDVVVVNISTLPAACTVVDISTEESSLPDAIPDNERPVEKSLISLDYESSGEESDIWELENGPVTATVSSRSVLQPSESPRLTLPGPSATSSSGCPLATASTNFLFEETMRVEGLPFSSDPRSTLDEGSHHLSDYLQTG